VLASLGYSDWFRNRSFLSTNGGDGVDATVQQQDDSTEEMIEKQSDDAEWKTIRDVNDLKTDGVETVEKTKKESKNSDTLNEKLLITTEITELNLETKKKLDVRSTDCKAPWITKWSDSNPS